VQVTQSFDIPVHYELNLFNFLGIVISYPNAECPG
jgi:hypothetical protein